MENNRPTPVRHRNGPYERSVSAVLLLPLLLGACAVGPKYTSPPPPAQHHYIAHEARVIGLPPQTLEPTKEIRANWWTALGSPELDTTVALALSNNWTIEVAQASLARAGEAVAAARGGLYPHIDTGETSMRRKFGANSLGPQAAPFAPFSAYAATGTFVFEPDVFGGTRRTIEQAEAQEVTQQEAVNAAHLTVAGATVVLALQIAATRAQLAAARNVLSSDETVLSMIRVARAAGATSDTEVTVAQARLEHERTLLPPFNQQLDAARDALTVLVGRAETDWSPPAFSLERMSLPEDLPLVVPSALVRARPDIRAAEAQLHEASAGIGVAKADLYPRST
jgi:NodT family efflux transporter outer membrane factor (OMF) lipoprotein